MEVKLIKDIFPGLDSSFPSKLSNIDGILYFVANDGTTGRELWTSDGTTVRLVKDINPGIGDSDPTEIVRLGNSIYFVARDVSGLKIWRSDGTSRGTDKIGADINDPYELTPISINARQSLIFGADGPNGYELYISDGTTSGTTELLDIYPGRISSYPSELTKVNIDGADTVFFAAEDEFTGIELWRTDGTAVGTFRVLDIFPGARSGLPYNLTEFNGNLCFAANDGLSGFELWRSDGTEAGTRIVGDINPIGSSDPDNFIDVNGILYFTANDGTNGTALWKYDGIAAKLVKDINPTASDPLISNLTNVKGLLYFTANDGSNGNELWKSDGITTTLVKNINSGIGSSDPLFLTDVGGTLYFSADNGINGRELWRSDGSEAGTVLVADIREGLSSGNPENLVAIGSNLYFSADVPANGGNIGIELSGLSSGSFVEYYRFRNTGFSTGTYLFTGKQERDAILANPNFNRTFELEGNGAIAFKASEQSRPGLEPFYRLQSKEVPGTYLFVGPQEYDAIFAQNSSQRDKWIKEGLDAVGVDIAEFYLYGVGAKQGIEYNRFQNIENGTYIFTGPQETLAILNNPNFSNVFVNQGVAFEAFV